MPHAATSKEKEKQRKAVKATTKIAYRIFSVAFCCVASRFFSAAAATSEVLDSLFLYAAKLSFQTASLFIGFQLPEQRAKRRKCCLENCSSQQFKSFEGRCKSRCRSDLISRKQNLLLNHSPCPFRARRRFRASLYFGAAY